MTVFVCEPGYEGILSCIYDAGMSKIPQDELRLEIKNSGQNYKCAGCWKVYCNECETMKLFHKYRKCRDIYRSLWQNGRSVVQLTVAGASA